MSGTPLATAFVRVLPDTAGFGPALRAEAAAATPTIVPHVNTAEADGKIKGFINDVGGKLIGAFAIAEVLKSGVEAQESYQAGLARLEAGLKSTGGVAGLTAEEMEKLADKISNYSGQNRNTIVSTEQLLLAFHNIRDEAGKGNDVFTRTTQIAADMAARLGGDASSQAIKLGKALEDPIHGTSTLTRVGVQFTVAQKELIKSLVESGDSLGAQKVILDQLDAKFAGSAKAVGSTLKGEIDKAKNSFEELSGEIVSAAAPALDLILKGAVDTGKAFFAGVTFLKEHKDAVIAVVAAYATLKWEAIAGAVASFASTGARLLDGFALKALYAADSLRTLGGGSLLLGGLLGGAALAGVGLITFGLLHMSDGAAEAERNVAALTAGLDLTKLNDIATGIARVQAQLDAPSKQHAFDVGLGGAQERILQLRELQKLTEAQEAAQGKIELVKQATAQLSGEFGISTSAVQDLAKAYHIDLSANMGDVEKKFDAVFKVANNSTDAMKANAGAVHELAAANTVFNTQTGVNNKALGSQIDLLAGVADQAKLTGDELLKQASSSLIAIAQETTNIQQLTAKGLNPTAIKALVDKGPQYVQAANQLSVKDLKQFGNTYQTELAAQWQRAAAVTSLGATKADRKAIDAIIAGQGAMDGATGKLSASITEAFLHEHPKAYAAAHDLYTVVQGEVDKLHGKTLQILLDDQASGNLQALSEDLKFLSQQINGLPAGIAVGIQPFPAGIASPAYNKSIFRAAGGLITGPGSETSDSIHAMLSNGEYVIPAATVKQLGAGFFDALPRFAGGGPVNLNDRWRMTISDAGLAQGLAGYDVGVKSSITQAQALLAPVGAGVARWVPDIFKVLALLGLPAALEPRVASQMQLESGGDPNAINLSDSNAAKGDPSKGLMQTVAETFAAYAGPYLGLGIYNGFANLYAGVNYASHRYAGDPNIGLGYGHGYDNGGPLMPGWTMAYNGTGKPENVQTAEQASRGSAPLLHIGEYHAHDGADAAGLAQQLGAQYRASMISRRV